MQEEDRIVLLESHIKILLAALKPFADYARNPSFDKLPLDFVITNGSSIAIRQLQAIDCSVALQAYENLTNRSGK